MLAASLSLFNSEQQPEPDPDTLCRTAGTNRYPTATIRRISKSCLAFAIAAPADLRISLLVFSEQRSFFWMR